MSNQLSLLDIELSLDTLPSAKVKKEDRAGLHGWTNFYAAFSETFCLAAISNLAPQKNSLLLDPFVGSGTSLVAAIKMGIPAIGIDIDPFACLLSRAKIAINADPKKVTSLLKPSKVKKVNSFSDEAISLFDRECLVYASTVFNKIYKSTGTNRSNVLQTLLNDPAGIYDSEAIALGALCIGASKAAHVIKGSNPTWYRKKVDGETVAVEELKEATKSTIGVMLQDIKDLSKQANYRNVVIYNSDFSELNKLVRNQSVDILLTSPPYMTRLDYVIKHLPNLLILSGFIDVDINTLRKNMVGTSKIVSKGSAEPRWGKSCIKTLSKIKNHNSYASDSYYVWTYFQYFQSIYNFFSNLDGKLRINGRGFIVVQNSYYKDLEIQLSKIFIEMLDSFNIAAKTIKEVEVSTNMRSLNPNHIQKNPTKRSSEDTIFLQKN